MAYTGSQAQAGRLAQLAINTGSTTTPVWTTVGEVKDAAQSGAAWGTVDVTNFESGINKEFITTIRDNGIWKLTCNRVSGDAGQVALKAAYASGLAAMFQLTYPLSGAQTAGDTDSFSALVESVDVDVSTEKAIEMSVALKVTGAITSVVGA